MELNERLARWAGLHHNKPTGGFWWDTEGNLVFDFHKSDEKGFESLDVCFKWLVPKVENYFIGSSVGAQHTSVVWYHGHSYQGKAETPALALCRAIEKLIDEEE